MSPRRGRPHDHAYEVETLQEKADRICREQDLPPEAEPHRSPPLPCFWHEDTDGARYLIPGCMTRVNNPDVGACDCPTLNEQLDAVRHELATLQRHYAGLQAWHDHITRAVYDHTDGVKIMKAAADRAGVGR